MPNRRGYRLRPLLDEDGEPTTRAELLAAERTGRTDHQANWEPEWRPDPDTGEQIARLVELQAAVRRAS